jgi:hypothetical protein
MIIVSCFGVVVPSTLLKRLHFISFKATKHLDSQIPVALIEHKLLKMHPQFNLLSDKLFNLL